MNYPDALIYQYPQALWVMENPSDYSTLVWDGANDDAKPSKELLDTLLVTLPAILESKAVKAQRLAAYQQTADPLFFGFQRGDNTEQEWLDAVQAVKDQYPYPDGV